MLPIRGRPFGEGVKINTRGYLRRNASQKPTGCEYPLRPTFNLSNQLARPGAPIIKKSIQGQPKLHKYDSYKTTEIISYVIPEGQDGEDLRPITFLDCGITDGMDRYCQSLYSVLPLSAKGSEALRLGDINWGFPLNGYEPDDGTDIPSDDKVGEFSPASHRACHTLYPGQSISFTDYMYPFEWLEERLRVGESYVYRFNGKRIRWWNWGIKEVNVMVIWRLLVTLC